MGQRQTIVPEHEKQVNDGFLRVLSGIVRRHAFMLSRYRQVTRSAYVTLNPITHRLVQVIQASFFACFRLMFFSALVYEMDSVPDSFDMGRCRARDGRAKESLVARPPSKTEPIYSEKTVQVAPHNVAGDTEAGVANQTRRGCGKFI